MLDAREQLTAAAAAAGQGATPLAPELDYLIGCEYSESSNQLWLLAGNNAGTVGFFPVLEPPMSAAAAAAAAANPGTSLFGPPAAVLAGGHDDIVRSVLWPGAGGSLCLSGGEDSKVCTWSLAPTAGGSSSDARPAGSSGSEGAMRRQPQHVRRRTPY